MIYCKRVYETANVTDGKRAFVDRLWPRGMRKEDLIMDVWAKDAAPSNDLRKWYHQDLSRQEEFCVRYTQELEAHPEHCQLLLNFAREGDLTLLYASSNPEFNHAQVLADYLCGVLKSSV